MRIHRSVLVALLVSACVATPAVPTQVPTPAVGSAPPSGRATPVASAMPSASAMPTLPIDGHPLSELLPTAINGVATKSRDLNPVSRDSPRVFLKVIARLGQTPDHGEVALAYTPDSTVYAVRIKDATAMDVLLAYLGERGYRADESPPTESIGDKQVTRLGSHGGNFVYTSDDVFYFIECATDQLAADLIRLLP